METPTRRTELLEASPRMFESDWLDRFSRVHPITPVVIFLPVISGLIYAALSATTATVALLFVVLGYVFWTLSEYWIHRAIFHFEPEKGPGARFHWMVHGVHHEHPNDPLRLVMPPAISLPLAGLFAVAFWATLGEPHWYPFCAGFLSGYLIYDMMHYHLHHHPPRTRIDKLLREIHMRHHFQDETSGFGISAPYWDKVFGTFPRRKRRSP